MKFSASWLVLLVAGPLAHAAAAAPSVPLTPVQRLEPERLEAVHAAREQFAHARQTLPDHGVFEDFRAVLHVHAEDSNHTLGTRAEVLAAAKRTGVRVVMLTDHRGPQTNTWRGLRDGVLFFAGSEDGKGALWFPGFSAEGRPVKEEELRFITHVEERPDTPRDGFAGLEICNRHTDAILDKSLEEHLRAAAKDPAAWRVIADKFARFPDEMFAAGTDYRTNLFVKWDQESATRPFTGIGANDAHQNTVINGLTLDPYEVSFRNLSTHILARELTEPAIREALRSGRVYVSHDWLCDPTGFAFGGVNNLGVFQMGDTVPHIGSSRIVGYTPVPAHLKLFHNGKLVKEVTGTNLTHNAKEFGAYRLEAWLKVGEEERPWIYANPVYLKLPTADDLNLPSSEVAANVGTKKDMVYFAGHPDDADKHKLDLYFPKDKKSAPVFFFVHGGAWKYGDRSQYPAIGNRFARDGVLTVVPSYRLAPAHPHPAQIEDVAAAFAWTVQHVAEYGGDTNRLYVGGHSAGGHLSALLALNDRWLQPNHLSTGLIKGVLGLSGVYNLTAFEAQSAVFGKDPEVRRDASPIFFAKPPAPPFLLTYCEWDYLTLPAQAKLFHAALRRAGVSSELVYVPRQTHITEMVHVPQPDDLTAQAILKFIK